MGTLKKALIIGLALAAGAGAVAAGDLRVTLVDVGVGDAILVQTPGGRHILVDGGYPGPGNSVLVPYLKSRGVQRLHQVVATHQDLDHTGGLNAVLGDSSFQVDYVVYKDTAVPSRLTNLGARPTVVLSTVTAPPAVTLEWDPALDVEVLNAREGQAKVNNNSIVLKVTFRRVSFLLTGDIEAPVIDEVVSRFPDEFPVTVLKVPHHGSNSSVSSLFPSRARPALALVSAAKDINNNPDPDTLDAYASLGIPVWRTDVSGHITVITNGVSYSVVPSRQATDASRASSSIPVHAYPNPAPGRASPAQATVVYELNGAAEDALVTVYALSGVRVRRWEGAPRAAGVNFLEWDLKNDDGQDVANGLYVAQVEAQAGGARLRGRAKIAVLRP
jgi:competence protein ComEC